MQRNNACPSSLSFAVQKDGFTGEFYPAKNRRYGRKALIVMGGSDGSFAGTRKLAQKFSSDGMDAMALAYWNEPGLPRELREVPVEFVERAVQLLKKRGVGKIGIYGISKGAELALVAAISPVAWPSRLSAASAWALKSTGRPDAPPGHGAAALFPICREKWKSGACSGG